MDIYHILGYIGAVVTGLVLGLLGGGGALLSIPVLVYLFNLPASIATGYSLFLIGITAMGGALENIRKQLVDYKAAVYYGVPSALAVYSVRRFLIPALPHTFFTVNNFTLDKDHFILFLLVLVMLIAGYKMIRHNPPPKDEHTGEVIDVPRLAMYAVLIGSFLGLVGAGGGFLMIPALVLFAHLPMRKAVGTSLLLVSLNSFIGFLGDVHSNPAMDWTFLFAFSSCSIAGVLAGTYLHRFIHGDAMKKYFGWFILILAVTMIVKEISRGS
ncbi:MAG: sulfite exporter TauE/SafE family protein [Chitinophagales bacterium]|nr:sulfite exporter TauE/SafE family protein [Chitinophagales bacterium]